MTQARGYRPVQPDTWLPVGTAVYGQVGVVAVDEVSATVQCAMCGRWLNTVSGSHLTKRHGITVGSTASGTGSVYAPSWKLRNADNSAVSRHSIG